MWDLLDEPEFRVVIAENFNFITEYEFSCEFKYGELLICRCSTPINQPSFEILA